MNRPWMPLYVADYLADTAHLNAAESGAYLHLIMHYWLNGALPDNEKQLARIARLTDLQWRSTKVILADFFQDGWKHKRIDAELARAADISSKRRASAVQRHSKTDANAQQLDTHARASSPSQSQKKDSPADAGPSNSPSDGYAFEFGVIRLRKKDFDQWIAAFAQLDLRAELVGLEPWAAQQSNWFVAVSQALAKKNRETKIRVEQQKTAPAFRWNGGIEGVT